MAVSDAIIDFDSPLHFKMQVCQGYSSREITSRGAALRAGRCIDDAPCEPVIPWLEQESERRLEPAERLMPRTPFAWVDRIFTQE